MKKSSLIFRIPKLYSLGIRLLYFGACARLKNMVGKDKKVFEPACGYGRIKKYLDPSCTYSGIDLNENFVNYGRKNGLDLKVGDILKKENYQESDIIILSDILHHLSVENIKKLVSIASKFAKEKVVIIEPIFVDVASGKNVFSKFLAKFFSWVDYDGINKIEKWFSRKDYDILFEELKQKNNFSKMKIVFFNHHYFIESYL